MPHKKTKVKLHLKNLAMLPRYFDYIFVHLRQKARFRLELSPKFFSTLDVNPAQTCPESEPDPKTGPTYNFAKNLFCFSDVLQLLAVLSIVFILILSFNMLFELKYSICSNEIESL